MSELAAPLDMSLELSFSTCRFSKTVASSTPRRSVVCTCRIDPAVLTSGNGSRVGVRCGNAVSTIWVSCSRKESETRNEDDPRHIHARPHLRREHPRGLAGLDRFLSYARNGSGHPTAGRCPSARSIFASAAARSCAGRMPTGIETSYVAMFHVVVPERTLFLHRTRCTWPDY